MKARILELLKLNSLRVTKPLTQKSYDEHPPPFIWEPRTPLQTLTPVGKGGGG